MTDLAAQYQMKTDLEHILHNGEMYIGPVAPVDAHMWVYDDAAGRIVMKNIEYVPGLYKIYDEFGVNSRDQILRIIHSALLDKKFVTSIKFQVSEDGTITIENDGNGIDVAKHPDNGLWIPEMVFAHLRTSTNYNKDEKKIVGGKNGFGAKLGFIYSVFGSIETVDHVRGLKYYQEFKNNLSEICPPTITKLKSQKPYTKIVFKPDYKRFGMPNGITSDMCSLFKKRAYDISAVSDHSVKKVQVSYNGEPVPVKNFQQYIDKYIGAKDVKNGTGLRVYEAHDERWEYAVALSPTHEFMAVSFVNGICTAKGGKHVDYIVGQITRKLCAYIEKKKKITVNQNSIKEQLVLFLRCDIENPSFDSQTKDYMSTVSKDFGSSCTVGDKFIEDIAKMGVMDVACSLTEAKENKSIAKKTDGTKTRTIRGIANFVDANFAGTNKSGECTLILCEGLSALSGVVSGLSKEHKDIVGILPLKGKCLNVRGETAQKIGDNKEITDLKKVLGLESGKTYDSIEDVHKHLRYSKVMILCDQDTDGSHIKGLCINLFHSEWASLLKIPGFLSFMNTPILRAKKGQVTMVFYNEGEYQTWRHSVGAAISSWTIKYFKGLGTSTSAEFKGYFADMKIVDFVHTGTVSDDVVDMVFNKKRAHDRKPWLEAYDKNAYLDTGRKNVDLPEFFHNEMRHFSIYDCARSIPNGVDGLKTSQRKILFAAFKRKLTSEIKVAQFSGYVSEHSAYHHGEASLNGAIINMAQNYVGSNNINILEPNGQFGTRLNGGDDSASERYIFTQLNPITRKIFPEADDAVLTYLDDDGTLVEPEYYVPIIPTALVNGISGIGTGFSCSIPSYDPKQLISYLRTKLTGAATAAKFVPYYEGFKGAITPIDEHKFLVKGAYEVVGADKIRITELPVGTWTMPYTTFLESLVDGGTGKDGKKIPPSIKDFVSMCTEVAIDFTVVFPSGKLAELEASRDENGITGIHKLLKLSTTISVTNMHLFNSERRLNKYAEIEDIISAFYDVRIGLYEKRKAFLEKELRNRLLKLTNKARYIQETLSGVVDLRKKNATQVTELMTSRKYDTFDGDFKYLIKMPMDSVTEENVRNIIEDRDNSQKDLDVLLATSLAQMWINELDILEREYDAYKAKRQQIQSGAPATTKVKKTNVKAK
jgi:DNA topoisomerase II